VRHRKKKEPIIIEYWPTMDYDFGEDSDLRRSLQGFSLLQRVGHTVSLRNLAWKSCWDSWTMEWSGGVGIVDELGWVESDNRDYESLTLPSLLLFESRLVHGWSVARVGKWLDKIGMGRYKDGFAQKRVTGQILPSLALDEGKFLQHSMGVSPEDSMVLVRHILHEVFAFSGT